MRAIDSWARQSQMDFAGNAFFPVQKYSNFALALAATFKSQTMATQRAKYNELYDKLQGKGANLFGEAETLSFVEAVERVYNIKLNRENKQDVTNDGSNVLAHGSEPSSTGQPRSAGGTRSTEPTAAGERTADHTAGTATDNRQSTTADVGEKLNEKKRSEEDATRLHPDIFEKENGELVSPNSGFSTDKDTTNNRNDQTFDEKKDGVQIENEPFPADISESDTIERTIGEQKESEKGFAPSLGESIKIGFKGDDIFIQIDHEHEDGHYSSSQFAVRNAAQNSIDNIASELSRNEITDFDEAQCEALKSMLYERAVAKHLQAFAKGYAAVETSETPEREFEQWLNTLPARDIRKHIAPLFAGANTIVGMRAQRIAEKAFGRVAKQEIIDYTKECIADGNTLDDIKSKLDDYVAENIYNKERISQAGSEYAAKIAEETYNEQKGRLYNISCG